MRATAGRSSAHLAAMRVHQLTLTTAQIIAFGAVSVKALQVPVPNGYRLFMARCIPNGHFYYVDNLANMAKLLLSADMDADPLLLSVPIDNVFGAGNQDKGVLVPEVYLGRDVSPTLSADTGFTLHSIDTTDGSEGPAFNTLDPDPLLAASVTIEIHFLLATNKAVTL